MHVWMHRDYHSLFLINFYWIKQNACPITFTRLDTVISSSCIVSRYYVLCIFSKLVIKLPLEVGWDSGLISVCVCVVNEVQDYNTGSLVFLHENLPMCFFHQKVYVYIMYVSRHWLSLPRIMIIFKFANSDILPIILNLFFTEIFQQKESFSIINYLFILKHSLPVKCSINSCFICWFSK